MLFWLCIYSIEKGLVQLTTLKWENLFNFFFSTRICILRDSKAIFVFSFFFAPIFNKITFSTLTLCIMFFFFFHLIHKHSWHFMWKKNDSQQFFFLFCSNRWCKYFFVFCQAILKWPNFPIKWKINFSFRRLRRRFFFFAILIDFFFLFGSRGQVI